MEDAVRWVFWLLLSMFVGLLLLIAFPRLVLGLSATPGFMEVV